MASFDLWIDGHITEPNAVWTSEVNVDLDRLEWDPTYRRVVNHYIQQALDNLAKEIEAIGIAVSPKETSYEACDFQEESKEQAAFPDPLVHRMAQ